MGMSVERYDTLEQSPKNEGNTLEQKEHPWKDRVDKKDEDILRRVFNKLNIYRSFDQGN